MGPKKSRVPAAYEELGRRLREAREVARFSQAELGTEIGGLSRSSLANYEFNQARLPFAVGLDICRRLDLCPRWLATGDEPKHPYVSPEDLGAELPPRSSRLGFIEGYDALLRSRLQKWIDGHGPSEAVRRSLEGGLDALLRQLSLDQLEARLIESVAAFRTSSGKHVAAQKRGQLLAIAAILRELEARHGLN